MRILTCNVRVATASDGENGWEFRKQLCADVIASQRADVVCFQEMNREQFTYLAAALSEFATYGMADHPLGEHPLNAIFHRKDLFAVVESAGYWLSETPHISGSKSWDSKCIRFANWVRLKEQATGKQFRMINTHLDHVSQPARENQARILVEDASAFPAEFPQFLTGDMNCDADNEAYRVFKSGGWQDTYSAIHGVENPGITYHGFKGLEWSWAVGKMDFIFCRGDVRVTNSEIITDSREGRYPSDHFFISADVEI